MSKKSQKLLFSAAVIGLAAVATAAYFKKSKAIQNDLDGDDDYEDDFQNETEEDEEEDTFSKEDLEDAQVTTEKRHYVPINLEETKEGETEEDDKAEKAEETTTNGEDEQAKETAEIQK